MRSDLEEREPRDGSLFRRGTTRVLVATCIVLYYVGFMMTTKSVGGYTQSERVARDIAQRIELGELQAGQKLASENRLAEEYGASRGTIRRALALLKESALVETHAGSGSYVAFHGSSLEGARGWTAATAEAGMPTSTEVLATELIDIPKELEDKSSFSEVFRITRLRRLDGVPVSLEISLLPRNERVDAVMEFGLLGGSISKTMQATGMRARYGKQDVSCRPLGAEQAALLEREPGSFMLVTHRVGLDQDGELVEAVDSWLDPAHFTLHLTFEE